MLLGKLRPADFLARYWQRRPLLIKNAFPGFADPVSPEELAGLACEREIESRLVFTRKNTWELECGPFRARDFTALPARNWTLLVQAVDQWLPEVKALLASVSFIPSWRVDDVMISYATANGGVGPHFDYYDVFLVQGRGSRVWQTGQHCTSTDVLRNDSGLKLLKDFRCKQEFLLQTGDVLYVPPGVAHWGVSRDDSLCYSIGFRAPSVAEMLLGFSEHLGSTLAPDLRYTDPPRKTLPQAGEIDARALKQARRLLLATLRDETAFAQWFGSQMTEPKYAELLEAAAELPDLQQPGCVLLANAASRFAWQRRGKQLQLFADGECFALPDSMLARQLCLQLCSPDSVLGTAVFARNKRIRAVLDALYRQGSLVDGEEAV